jgi:UDP-N-acetylmuramoylalanine--D-glutamate ligase
MKLVLGLGVTGFSIARFLLQHKIAFKVADSRQTPKLLSEFLSEFPLIEPFLGDWDESLLEEVDEIFISPGVAQQEKIVIWGT